MRESEPAPDLEQWNRTLRGPVPFLDGDQAAGFQVLDTFERFNQKNDIFCRSFWDKRVHSKKTEIFYETAATAIPVPSPANFAEVQEIFQRNLKAYLNNDQDLDVTVAQMDRELQRSMRRANR